MWSCFLEIVLLFIRGMVSRVPWWVAVDELETLAAGVGVLVVPGWRERERLLLHISIFPSPKPFNSHSQKTLIKKNKKKHQHYYEPGLWCTGVCR
jgi:hypothetical protein